MRRLLEMLPLTPALMLLVAGGAGARIIGIPSPYNSTVPACMALCPMGDLPFVVVVRDLASNPIAGSLVVLDFSQCPGASLCRQLGGDPYILDPAARTLRALTDANGSIDFHARVGGTGGPGSVRVFVDGVLLKYYALASPDQDGDGVVGYGTGADDAMFAAKLGTSDPTADFNCDGHVDLSDQQVFFAHHSQSCVGWVDPARRGTWGELKVHYR
jgi:hypothetical protein